MKIIEARINNDTTGSDIARSLGIPGRTVRNVLATELANVCHKSSAVAKLIDNNNKLQSLADTLLEDYINSKDEKLTP
jgi:hypothetical protein